MVRNREKKAIQRVFILMYMNQGVSEIPFCKKLKSSFQYINYQIEKTFHTVSIGTGKRKKLCPDFITSLVGI